MAVAAAPEDERNLVFRAKIRLHSDSTRLSLIALCFMAFNGQECARLQYGVFHANSSFATDADRLLIIDMTILPQSSSGYFTSALNIL